ncbi:MAG: VOC family protein [Candidatus Woesearchaeota archaeon]|jgi:PhnB protein
MIKLNPYLNFMGRTEEAFNFYKSVFGGEFSILQKFKDVENLPEKEKMNAADLEKIMHVSLKIGNDVLMGTDALESMGHTLTVGNNISISIHTDSREEADRLFSALQIGGKVEMPMMDMFWGDYFGMVDDKFGIKWMVDYTNKN